MDAAASHDQGVVPTQQSTNGPNAEFKKFDSYPWVRDRSFLQGLMATLGPSLASKSDRFMRQKAQNTTLHARIWWYKSRFNVDIDRTAYDDYSASHPSSSPDTTILAKLDEIQQRMGIGPAPSSTRDQSQNQAIPAWQLNAPKVDLSKKADDGATHASTGSGGAPYPDNFQALIEAVTMGKPIPGIKEIPNTVVRPPGVTPFGKMKAPRKPWEKDLPPDALAQTSVLGDVIDKEFPPLPDDGAATTATETEKTSA
ncbi:hypothetical protein MMYC01_201398 [Madurella mycetomatis]|uniref:Uncharacterized protein n=1 Tax=Madurella mycetomatis TaxID=100816 RepID=A0A175WE71_9PEZI|nr:hypothetical protein MMYC01_201398 [Madurella mycetomatis]